MNGIASAAVVFAKVPGLGIAKSRIAATHGQETAEQVYAELLGATARIVSPLPHHVAFTGADAPGPLKDIFGTASSFFQQCDGDLGKRIQHAFQHLFGQGYREVCALGCDCPSTQSSDITAALAEVRSGTDVVLGPASDGGYYLIALTRGKDYVFSVSGWGTSKLLGETVAAIRRHGDSYKLLRELTDIDMMADYQAWKCHSPEKGADT
ncbi:MAG: DUF2064 domain-containing protein [Chitinivibrionales bacterium]|nr:DUF2064 domain-containing protein [Chitinivibrionales bacterium]MBD3396479.1 DUF2064 domain-containing protein [Chitinivibrionales bacterium]